MAKPTDTTTPETPNARARYRVGYRSRTDSPDNPTTVALPAEDSLPAIADNCTRLHCCADLVDERGWDLGYVDEGGTAHLFPVPIDRTPK
jgi:hypothetical protein